MEPATKDGTLPTNPFILSRTIKEAVGAIDSAYRDRAKNLVIKVRSEKKAKKLMDLTELIDKETKIRISEHPTLNQCKCIVTCHSVNELSDEELAAELEDQGVIKVHRFKHRGVRSATMVITLHGTVPPKEIAFGYDLCRTRPYKASPMQCFKCFAFGHTKTKCPAEVETCRNCSETHAVTKDETGKTICDKNTKCKNCNGDHSPASRTCPRYIEEEAILDIRAKKDVSPREARRLYEEEKTAANTTSYAAIAKTSTEQQETQLKAKLQQQEAQLKAKLQQQEAQMKKDLEKARKDMQKELEDVKKAMQAELDVARMALSMAKQEIKRLRNHEQIEEDPNRKRKVSESESRSDESDCSEEQFNGFSIDKQNDDNDEKLCDPEELPSAPEVHPEGTNMQPAGNIFADPKDPNTTSNELNKNANQTSKKKKSSNPKKPKTGNQDGTTPELNNLME